MLLLGPNFLLNAPSSWAAEVGVYLEPETIWTFWPGPASRAHAQCREPARCAASLSHGGEQEETAKLAQIPLPFLGY